MLVDFIFLLILFGLLYSYTSSQNQFAATASAIRQIWSGSCRLSCRHSEHSALSGLSGLPPRSSAGYNSNRESHGLVATGTIFPPESSLDCSCESCPCALVDNFLRQCRPATTLYGQLLTSFSGLICYVIQLIIDTYNSIVNAFHCEITCTQHGKVSNKLSWDTHDKISLARDEVSNKSLEKNDKVNKLIKEDSKSTQLAGTSKDPDRKEDVVQKLKSVSKHKADDLIQSSKTAQDPPTNLQSSSDTLELLDKGYCSKCIAKGQTCINVCPRAKEKK